MDLEKKHLRIFHRIPPNPRPCPSLGRRLRLVDRHHERYGTLVGRDICFPLKEGAGGHAFTNHGSVQKWMYHPQKLFYISPTQKRGTFSIKSINHLTIFQQNLCSVDMLVAAGVFERQVYNYQRFTPHSACETRLLGEAAR